MVNYLTITIAFLSIFLGQVSIMTIQLCSYLNYMLVSRKLFRKYYLEEKMIISLMDLRVIYCIIGRLEILY